MNDEISTKTRISVLIDDEYLQWIDRKIADKVFASRSHAVVYAIKRLIDDERQKGK